MLNLKYASILSTLYTVVYSDGSYIWDFDFASSNVIPIVNQAAETLLVNEYNLQEIESPDFDPHELTEIEEIIDEDSLDYQYSYDYPYGKDSEEGEDSENFHPGDEIMVRSGRRKPKGGKTKAKTKVSPVLTCDEAVNPEEILKRNQNLWPYGINHNDQLIHREKPEPGRKPKPIDNTFAKRKNFYKDHGIKIQYMGREVVSVDLSFMFLGLKFNVENPVSPNSFRLEENNLFFSPFVCLFLWHPTYAKTRGIYILKALLNQDTTDGASYFRMLINTDPKQNLEMNNINRKLFGLKDFKPLIAFIWTMEGLPSLQTAKGVGCKVTNTYQVITISNGPKTYSMVNYGHMGWGAFTVNNRGGFGNQKSVNGRVISGEIGGITGEWYQRFEESNVNFPRRYVFDATEALIKPSMETFQLNSEPIITYTDIELNFESSINNIQKLLEFSKVTTDDNFVNKYIVPHGCWCGKFTSDSSGFGGHTVSKLDTFCKQWHQCRACTKIKSCNNTHITSGEFKIRHDYELHDNLADQFLCHELSSNSCGKDTCSCDLHFTREIIKYLENPMNQMRDTTHHWKAQEDCKIVETVNIPNINDKVDSINDINSMVLDTLQNINQNLKELDSKQVIIHQQTVSSVSSSKLQQSSTNIGLLQSKGDLEDTEVQQSPLTETELDVAVVWTNDECCGEAPLWKPYSSAIQVCDDNRIKLKEDDDGF